MSQVSTPAQRNALKTATKALIVLLGGIDAAATITRLQRSRLASCGDMHAPDHMLPIDVVLDMETIAGEPLITQALAAEQGRVLLRTEVGSTSLTDHFRNLATDAGRTLSDVIGCDDHDEDDLERLLTDVANLERDASEALCVLHAKLAALRVGRPKLRSVGA